MKKIFITCILSISCIIYLFIAYSFSGILPTKTSPEHDYEVKKAHAFLEQETSSGVARLLRAVKLLNLKAINELRVQAGLKPYSLEEWDILFIQEVDSVEAD